MDDQAFNTESVAADQLKSFIERAERLNEEKDGINSDLSDLFKEAKANGFNTKVLKKIIALRQRDYSERQEEQAIMDLYLEALGMAG
ncbi:DUF2312 domain-containing protein [Microvirga zambiensis]|uniref:DUF2312 domain-containing protein n=1 Tax=Microvirga zambiensis TaxID=1402137 RepID=UPI00191DD80E|nr:DUF2312 domain-containing protein [Microvirga zambiensis]